MAIVFGTGSGVLTARTMSLFLKTKTNPQIGSAGIASVPIAARVFQCRGEQGEPGGVPRFPPLTLIERLPTLLAARDVPAERRRPERSIADITFSWQRLRWPTLALRHAGPWSRSISDGRDMTAAVYAGGGTLVLGFGMAVRARCSRGS